MEIVLHHCAIEVLTENNTNNKIVRITDPKSGITVIVPMVPDAAQKIAMALMGTGIMLPTLIPPKDLLKKNGS